MRYAMCARVVVNMMCSTSICMTMACLPLMVNMAIHLGRDTVANYPVGLFGQQGKRKFIRQCEYQWSADWCTFAVCRCLRLLSHSQDTTRCLAGAAFTYVMVYSWRWRLEYSSTKARVFLCGSDFWMIFHAFRWFLGNQVYRVANDNDII